MATVTSRPPAMASTGRRRTGSLTHPSRTGFLLVVPALAFVVFFVIVPVVFAIYMSLTNWPLIGPYRWTGLANYGDIPKDSVFLHSIVYTLIYTAIVTVPILVVGYVMAMLVRSGRRGAVLLRTLFFLPYVIGLSTLSFIALLELQPDSGAVNWLVKTLGLGDGSTAWLTEVVPATAAIIVLVVWATSGLTMVLLLGGMQSVPQELYEAADVDGASWWAKERLITIPLLRRTIALSLLLSTIGSLLAFNQFYILTQGGPGTSTVTMIMWVYQQAFINLHLGASAALAIVLIVVVGILSVVQFVFLREEDPA